MSGNKKFLFFFLFICGMIGGWYVASIYPSFKVVIRVVHILLLIVCAIYVLCKVRPN